MVFVSEINTLALNQLLARNGLGIYCMIYGGIHDTKQLTERIFVDLHIIKRVKWRSIVVNF